MPLNIKDPEVHESARKLASLTGTSITAAVSRAIDEALARAESAEASALRERVRILDEIALSSARLPLLDERSADEILGYDGAGVPR